MVWKGPTIYSLNEKKVRKTKELLLNGMSGHHVIVKLFFSARAENFHSPLYPSNL